MRASTAYFVGAGTIVVAIAIGLGGGIVAGNIMNPVAPKQGPDTGKMAQRAEAAATPATTSAPSDRVQYLIGSQAFGTIVAAPAEAKDEVKADAKPEAGPEAKPDTQSTQANAEPAPAPSQAAAVEPPKQQIKPTSPSPVTKPAEQQASTEPVASPDNAYAKARESDVKRTTSERRRTDRRERSAERYRYDSREPRGMRDRTDWDDVARNIREDSDARDVASRPRGRIMLFGPGDDD